MAPVVAAWVATLGIAQVRRNTYRQFIPKVLLSAPKVVHTGTGYNVSQRIKRTFKRAGVTGHRPHDLRATFATMLIREGIDLITVQSYLGHASVATTQRYVLPNDEGVALVNRLSFAA